MLQVYSIQFTTFAYITEDPELVKQCMLNCLPTELRHLKIATQRLQSQFRDDLRILTLKIDKKSQLDKVLPYIIDNVDNSENFNINFENKLDLDEKAFHFRFDKFKAFNQELILTEGSDVIKCQLNYVTYISEENTFDNVSTLFRDIGLIL